MAGTVMSNAGSNEGRLTGPVAQKLAHDLNNLLSVVSGFAEVLAADLTDPQHQEDLRELQTAVNNAIALCARVLPASDIAER